MARRLDNLICAGTMMLVACGIGVIAWMLLTLLGVLGCVAAEDVLSPQINSPSPSSNAAAGDDSTVVVLQWAGGGGGLLVGVLFGWWRGRATPTKAIRRLVAAITALVPNPAERESIRREVCRVGSHASGLFHCDYGCTCDAAERLINRYVKAG